DPPDVPPAVGRPLVRQLAHRGGRRDRVDRDDLAQPVGDGGRGLVPVDRGPCSRGHGGLLPRRPCCCTSRATFLGRITAATAQGFPRGRRPGALSCGIVRGGATGEGGCARCETCYWPCANGGGATMTAILDAPIHASARALDEILALGRPTLVVFETPDCEPCRSLVPELASLARAFEERVLLVRGDA